MLLGVYETYLASISSIYLPTLFPMGIGLVMGGILFLLLIQFLLTRYHRATFYTIIGFVLGSVFVLYPGFYLNRESFYSLLLCFLAFTLAFSFEKMEKKNDEQ